MRWISLNKMATKMAAKKAAKKAAKMAAIGNRKLDN